MTNFNDKNTPLDRELLEKKLDEVIQEKDNNEKGDDSENKTVALKVIDEIKREKIVFFHDENKNGYAAVQGDGKEILKIKSRSFKQYIAHQIYKNTGRILSSEIKNNVVETLEGIAIFEGQLHILHVRIANFADAIWYNLGDGQIVHIDKDGWRLSENPPILFRTYPHQKTQVMPHMGGKVADICKYINIKDEKVKLLFQILTVAFFIPDFPHPLLALFGPQGSGKTTPLCALKSLIDPSVLETLSVSDSEREFVQTAFHHYFFVLDNLSRLPGWTSDALARAITGGGFSKRELFSDDDDVIYSFKRSIALNGINLVVEKGDLLERSILINLERIPRKNRRKEKDFWEEFEKDKPYILGAIFTAVSQALKIYSTVSLDSYPRMADFTHWGCAIAQALGYKQEDFLKAYYENINQQSESAVDASAVGRSIVALMEDGVGTWKGTSSDLLEALNFTADTIKENIKAKNWPKDASWLSRIVNTLIPNLLDLGIKVTRDHSCRPKKIILQRVDKNADSGDILSKISSNEAKSSLMAQKDTEKNVDINGGIQKELLDKSLPPMSAMSPFSDTANSLEESLDEKEE